MSPPTGGDILIFRLTIIMSPPTGGDILIFRLIIMAPPFSRGSHIAILLIIIIFLPPLLKITLRGKLTRYPNDIWYQQSVKQKLFHIEGTILNPIPL